MRGDRSKISDKNLKYLRENDPWELLQQALRITFGTELAISPFRAEYHSYINVQVIKGILKGYQIKRHPGFRSRDLMVEGSGFLQWLSVYALATNPNINVLLLDEPDAHLHCSLQEHMVDKLKELAGRAGKQVLMATHSTEILSRAYPEVILEVDRKKKSRFLKEGHQKVGLLAGLGSDYTPRIDALKQKKCLLLIEGEFDVKILQIFTKRLNRVWPECWVEWINKSGHKERKQLFLALKEEIPNLVSISLRDRDDDSLETVSEKLDDKAISNLPPDLYCKKWRRRHIESYLLWPQALAFVCQKDVSEIVGTLNDKYGIVIGENFPESYPPKALLDIRGKEILASFGVDPIKVAENIPIDKIPLDIQSILDDMENIKATI